MTKEDQVRLVMEGMDSGKYYFENGVFKLCDDYTSLNGFGCKYCQFCIGEDNACILGGEGVFEESIDLEPFMKRFPEQFI